MKASLCILLTGITIAWAAIALPGIQNILPGIPIILPGGHPPMKPTVTTSQVPTTTQSSTTMQPYQPYQGPPCLPPTEPVSSYPAVRPVNVSIDQLASFKQLCVTAFFNSGPTPDVDTICYTFFPVANSTSYTTYFSSKYSNGTISTYTATATASGCGSYFYGNGRGLFEIKYFGYIPCCCTFIGCSTTLSGDYKGYCVALSEVCQPISCECYDQVLNLFSLNIVAVTSSVQVAMKNPPNCVTQQPCNCSSC